MADTASVKQRAKSWIDTGMERHFIVRKGEHVAVDIPLLFAIVGALLAPWLAVIGVIIAVIKEYELKVVTPAAPVDTDQVMAGADAGDTTLADDLRPES
ncbi:MAG: DUF4342 domain-containing protein [Chloroflexi bacterium]|nr:DUF4342 domain-containing protein [Chloroflexota bacterium]